jgi:predicted transcriptional regulator
MTIIQTQVPDNLFEQIQSIAEQENLSVEQVVAQALAAQVAAWTDRNYLQQRSRQGSWSHFQQVLAKVPHVEPEERDRL